MQDAVDRPPQVDAKGACVKQMVQDKLVEWNLHIDKHCQYLPGIRS